MNYRKIKGTMYENQLKKMLEEKGFFVTRAAGSGGHGLTPDLIVLSTTKKFGLECKAWRQGLHFDKPKILAYQEWEQRTGMPLYIAWKAPHQEWRFFPLVILKETPAGFALTEKELGVGLRLKDILT